MRLGTLGPPHTHNTPGAYQQRIQPQGTCCLSSFSLSPAHPICYWPCLLYCCDRLNIVSLVLIARLLLLGLDMCDFRKVHCATFGRCGVGRARDARASPGEHTQKGWSCRSACSNAKSHKEKSKVHLAAARARARAGMCMVYIRKHALSALTRPYHRTSTASHPNCEVKPGRDWLVRSWGTRLEAQLSCYFLFAPVPCCPGPPHRTAPHRTAPPRQLPCRTEGAAGRRSQWLQHGKHGK